MEITFDPAKNARNLADRGLSFERVAEFDFETAVIVVDTRRDYGEVRFRAFGWLDSRLHALVFARVAKGIRVISFRKANKREVRRYEQETQP
ncbi:BrnT family toxin [Aromatoleum anaerobium]|uniref:BrnT family toxin n=1 Tax=Aromatoleum anaerobium TaxID=182180 RepID=A0ABX1PQC0_9RHOO|nr:BrnT family toxin [Aromatoleum anaerobium]MCK0507946.1 BrnT family toxin [Aromatoleum anaerobium]